MIASDKIEKFRDLFDLEDQDLSKINFDHIKKIINEFLKMESGTLEIKVNHYNVWQILNHRKVLIDKK